MDLNRSACGRNRRWIARFKEKWSIVRLYDLYDHFEIYLFIVGVFEKSKTMLI